MILIYRLRNGPASAASDITKSISVVTQCSQQFWSIGKKTGLASPACHQLEFGNNLPTDDEVQDAIFEAGGAASEPFGRVDARRLTIAEARFRAASGRQSGG